LTLIDQVMTTPMKSGNETIDGLFDWCVDLLLWGADLLGMSYNEINIWIFCVLWPVFTIGLMGFVVYQMRVIRKLRERLAR